MGWVLAVIGSALAGGVRLCFLKKQRKPRNVRGLLTAPDLMQKLTCSDFVRRERIGSGGNHFSVRCNRVNAGGGRNFGSDFKVACIGGKGAIWKALSKVAPEGR